MAHRFMADDGRTCVRFGEFRFDLHSHELWRRKEPVALPPKPARILAALLSRPGGLLTRAELYRVGWIDATVEYDLALNAAIRKVRSALQDRADAPIFIQTVPRRGYRFVAAVEPVPASFAAAVRGFSGTLLRARVIAVGLALGLLAATPYLFGPFVTPTVAVVRPRLLDGSLAASTVARLETRIRDTAARRADGDIAVLAAAAVASDAEYRVESVLYTRAGGDPMIEVQLIRSRDRAIVWSGAFNPRCPQVRDPEGFIAEYVAWILRDRVG